MVFMYLFETKVMDMRVVSFWEKYVNLKKNGTYW